MQVGMIGLGRMGANMARRLMRGHHECVVYDQEPRNVDALVKEGAEGVASVDELVSALRRPRAVWVMLPAGEPTEETLHSLGDIMEEDDILIDGGNSFYMDAVRRAAKLRDLGMHHVDVGTSGGIHGLDRGYCLMIGGDDVAVKRLEPLFRTLASNDKDIGNEADSGNEMDIGNETNRGKMDGEGRSGSTVSRGYLHCGPPGAGHFVKMVHNGIEYGMMQAYAEGFDMLASTDAEEPHRTFRDDPLQEGALWSRLPVAEIAELWRHGSVIDSWLLDLAAGALRSDSALSDFEGRVDDSGEGRWTVKTAVERGVSIPVLSAALYARFRSRNEHTFGEKLLSAMRMGFGGHVERKGE